ncbi:CapA family protein [Candidatus Omnitrophota bacterium]
MTKKISLNSVMNRLPLIALLIFVMSWTASSEKSEPQLTLAFVGDIMLGRQVGRAIQRTGDPALPFRGIHHFISSSDISIGNLECVFVDSIITGTYNQNVIRFPAYGETAAGLVLAGFDCCSVANNHALDFGVEGLRATVAVLEKNGVIPSGRASLHPTVIQKKGFSTALFSVWKDSGKLLTVDENNGYIELSSDSLFAEIAEAKKKHDVVILYPHWGKEYTGLPTESQKVFAHRSVDAGADIIAGHGPHQVQETERYGNSIIAYSLGNCIFDQKYEETRSGIILRVNYRRSAGISAVEVISFKLRDRSYVPEIVLDN